MHRVMETVYITLLLKSIAINLTQEELTLVRCEHKLAKYTQVPNIHCPVYGWLLYKVQGRQRTETKYQSEHRRRPTSNWSFYKINI